MDEEEISRRQRDPPRSGTQPRPAEIPGQRVTPPPQDQLRSGGEVEEPAPSARETDGAPEAVARVLSIARLTLAVLFGLLFLGLLVSYVLTRT